MFLCPIDTAVWNQGKTWWDSPTVQSRGSVSVCIILLKCPHLRGSKHKCADLASSSTFPTVPKDCLTLPQTHAAPPESRPKDWELLMLTIHAASAAWEWQIGFISLQADVDNLTKTVLPDLLAITRKMSNN